MLPGEIHTHTHIQIYMWSEWSESCSVVSDSLWPHGLYSPWTSPGQNTGVCGLYLFQSRDGTQVSHTAGRLFTSWATKEAHIYIYIYSHACIFLTFLNGLYHMTSALYPMNNLSYKAHLGHNWIKILLKNCKCLGLPWWSGGSDSTLPMQRAWVQSLVMELDPTCCT